MCFKPKTHLNILVNLGLSLIVLSLFFLIVGIILVFYKDDQGNLHYSNYNIFNIIGKYLVIIGSSSLLLGLISYHGG
jgi:hypothetical protein